MQEQAITEYLDAKFQQEQDPETRLWLMVIRQAVMDALSNINLNEARANKGWARWWLQSAHADFHTVCDCAGLDPLFISQCFRRFFSQHTSCGSAPAEGFESPPPPTFHITTSGQWSFAELL